MAGWALLAGAALLVAGPLISLLWTTFEASPAALWDVLGKAGLPALAGNVVLLGGLATVWALGLAVPAAWLVARTDLPGRRLVRALAPLPVAIPPYVVAISYALLLAPGGALHSWVAERLGLPPGQVAWPRLVYGTGGAAFVLGLTGAPAVFMLVHAALQRTNPSLEEAARSLGCGPWAVFCRVTLPLLAPALLAGALLVFAYACVDFGVVSLLRARTVTTTVYSYLLAGYSRPAAAALSVGLVATVWLVAAAQARALTRAQERQGRGSLARPGAPPLRLGAWRWPAATYIALVVGLGLALPVLVLVTQAARLGPDRLVPFLVAQAPYIRNSLVVAGGGATAALAVGLLLALVRGRVPFASAAAVLAQAGYAIPGTVLGLALVGLLLKTLPALYGRPGSLIVAYLILFVAPAFQACQSAVAQVTAAVEAAARSLGSSPLETVRRVILPLAAPGLFAGWALSFALAFRELAASVVLRPAGYDTLAVRIWVHTMDVGPDPRAAAVALLLLLIVLLVWSVALLAGRARGAEAR